MVARPLLGKKPKGVRMIYRSFVKRLIDLVVSSLLFLILLIPFLFITGILFFVNKGKPFFLHRRPGKGERPFYLIKFKTMTDERDEQGELLPDVERITGIGNFLRQTSLDEIPQFINVWKGDMSLIGPRPLLFRYLPLYNEKHRRRHDVRPGITGWAQVNGRNSISWPKKFDLDVYYVDHLSPGLDLKIVWMTIRKVLKREGVNQSEARPMQPFTGYATDN